MGASHRPLRRYRRLGGRSPFEIGSIPRARKIARGDELILPGERKHEQFEIVHVHDAIDEQVVRFAPSRHTGSVRTRHALWESGEVGVVDVAVAIYVGRDRWRAHEAGDANVVDGRFHDRAVCFVGGDESQPHLIGRFNEVGQREFLKNPGT